MKALVVYESMYGNTAAVAGAIAGALRERGLDAEAAPVTAVDAAGTAEFDLLVVGGPTHVHGMSSASSRKSAVDDATNDYADPTLDPGLRTWMKELPPGAERQAAAFDTRIDKPAWLTGSAARGIARRLDRRGFRLAAEPQSFLVTGENELVEGELEHAAAWGAKLANLVHAPLVGA
jgi:hypothetical protein